jgi:hypothetical protein
MVNCLRFVLAATSLVFPLALLAQPPVQTATISSHELHLLIKSAHSSAEYRQIASYFRLQGTIDHAKAADERAERDRRAHVNAALMQKYPRPVDLAQGFYEQYSADADQADALSRYYDHLAATQTERDGQVASGAERQ